ncbi:MAG: phospholipase D-like domain-containing protein, partial [Gemmataceae bacterium]
MWHSLLHYLGEFLSLGTLLHLTLSAVTIFWILRIKRDSTAAVAWCLTALLMPFFGPLLFLVFGYQRVYRPLLRKKKHKKAFRQEHPRRRPGEKKRFGVGWAGMARLAQRLDAFPAAVGNRVTFFYEGQPAFDAKMEAIRAARHHIHLEYFILQPDETGRALLALLAEKARQGVQVRLLYDAMGSHRLHGRHLWPLREAGGRVESFFPLFNPLRRRTQINLRNHRKILVTDGKVAFCGGMNIGDEYLNKSKVFGYWRDTDMQIVGPAVADLQRVFVEDWNFASDELLQGKGYFPSNRKAGESPVQVVMA